MVQGLMRAEGKAVSIAQLCDWFGVPRSTFYYRAERRRSPALDEALVELVSQLIEENPEYGVRRLTVLVRRKLKAAVNRKKIHRILEGQRVAGAAEAARAAATGPGMGLPRRAAERTLGNRRDACLLRPGRLVSPDGDYRLL
jgi:hypothetical protein